MEKILMVGDVHGSLGPFSFLPTIAGENDSITIICLGDFGGNFYFDYKDEYFKKKLGSFDLTYFVIRGNHEERPSFCYEYNPEKWHIETFWNNAVYVENEYPYIKYALDAPSRYLIPVEDKLLETLILPGAYSIDKYYRLSRGWPWFECEQPSNKEMELGKELAKTRNWDLVLSHTCPYNYQPTDLFLKIEDLIVDNTTEKWLNEIEKDLKYKIWCWGHFHGNRIYPTFNNSDRLMLSNDCYFDLNKYFCNNFNIENCLIKKDLYTNIRNLNNE